MARRSYQPADLAHTADETALVKCHHLLAFSNAHDGEAVAAQTDVRLLRGRNTVGRQRDYGDNGAFSVVGVTRDDNDRTAAVLHMAGDFGQLGKPDLHAVYGCGADSGRVFHVVFASFQF